MANLAGGYFVNVNVVVLGLPSEMMKGDLVPQVEQILQ